MSTDMKIGISAGVLFVGLLGGLAFYKFQQSGHTLEDLGTVAAGAVEAMFGGSATGGSPSAEPPVPTVNVTHVSAAANSANQTDSTAARILKASDASDNRPASPSAPAKVPPAREPIPPVKTDAPAPQSKPKNIESAPAWTPALPLATAADTETTTKSAVADLGGRDIRPLVMPPPPEASARREPPAKKAEPKPHDVFEPPLPPRVERPSVNSSGAPVLPNSAAGKSAFAEVVPGKPRVVNAAQRPEAPQSVQRPTGLNPKSRPVEPANGTTGLATPSKADARSKPEVSPSPAQGAMSKVEEMLRLLQGSSGTTDPAPVRQAQHAEHADEIGVVPAPPTIEKGTAPESSGTSARKAALPSASSSPAPSAPSAARSRMEGSVPSPPSLSEAPADAKLVGNGVEPGPAVDATSAREPALSLDRMPTAKPPDRDKSSAGGLRGAASEARTPIPSPRSFAASSARAASDPAPTGKRPTNPLSVPGAPDGKAERKVIAKAAPAASDPLPGPGPAKTTNVEQPGPAGSRRVVAPADVREELVAIGPTTNRVEKFQLVSRQELADRDPAEQVKVSSYDVESYVVLAGDTFESIAAAMYGRREYGPALAHYNRPLWPPGEPLRPGNRVKIPPAAILERASPKLKTSQPRSANVAASAKTNVAERPAEGTRPSAPAGPTYTVRQQETLFAIAKKTLGDGERWREIYQLNADRLENEYTIPVGVALRLPAGAKVE